MTISDNDFIDCFLSVIGELEEERDMWNWTALFLLDFAELCWTCGSPGHNRYNCPHDEYFGEGGLPQSFWRDYLTKEQATAWTFVHLRDFYERRGE